MLSQQQMFSRIIQILTTGKNTDGEVKDVVFAPKFLVGALDKEEVRELVRALRTTDIKIVSFPSCEGVTEVPKKLAKLFGGECSISPIKRKKGADVLFISSELFAPRWAKYDWVTKNVECIK